MGEGCGGQRGGLRILARGLFWQVCWGQLQWVPGWWISHSDKAPGAFVFKLRTSPVVLGKAPECSGQSWKDYKQLSRGLNLDRYFKGSLIALKCHNTFMLCLLSSRKCVCGWGWGVQVQMWILCTGQRVSECRHHIAFRCSPKVPMAS